MSASASEGVCEQCAHPNGPHEICGYPDERHGVPTSGWRVCPVEGCDCYATWSLAPPLMAALEERAQCTRVEFVEAPDDGDRESW